MATVDVLLRGFSFSTDAGRPAFCAVTLVESRGRRILVDTAHVGRRRELSAALAERGLSEASIDAVVMTHAHWDHVQNFDRFPQAPLLLHPRERGYASAPHENDWATPRWTGVAIETHRIQEVSEGEELASGVHVIELLGHSVGSIGLLGETEAGTACIAGDAVHSGPVATSGEPPLVFGSLSQAKESVARAVSGADVIYPGHDRPFRITDGAVDYLEPFALTITNLTPDREGLRFATPAASTWVMPGAAE